jgi:hypothetical protein
MSNDVKLSIKIENSNPIELNQLTLSLNALARQYDSFLRKSDEFDYHKTERKLYISKLESGCIYAELVPAIVPLLSDMNSIFSFGSYLKNIYDFFLGKQEKINHTITKSDCDDFSEIVAQTANDSGSSIHMDIKGNNNIVLCPIITVNSLDSNAIQNKIRKYVEGIDEQPKTYAKELMYWSNAAFVKQKTTDKVVIEKIDKKPKKVIFLNDHEKSVATSYNSKFPNKQWQDLAYIVDVEVSYIQDSAKEYKITKLYKEEIFDPEKN